MPADDPTTNMSAYGHDDLPERVKNLLGKGFIKVCPVCGRPGPFTATTRLDGPGECAHPGDGIRYVDLPSLGRSTIMRGATETLIAGAGGVQSMWWVVVAVLVAFVAVGGITLVAIALGVGEG